MPAKSMYSYADTLYSVIDEFRPITVFEWGPGTSTQILALSNSVEKVVSVENEIIFYDLIERLNFSNVEFKLLQDMKEYVEALDKQYDLIFVDGRARSECLDRASKYSDVIILHDSARVTYRESILKYKYIIWTDEGNTCFLTNDEAIYERAKKALSSLMCSEPYPELVALKKQAFEKGVVL